MGPDLLETISEVTSGRARERWGLRLPLRTGVANRSTRQKFYEGFRADLIVGNLVSAELKSGERVPLLTGSRC